MSLRLHGPPPIPLHSRMPPSRSRVSDARGKTTPAAHSKRQRDWGTYFKLLFSLARYFFIIIIIIFLVQLFAQINIRIVIGRHVLSYKLISFHSLQVPILPLFSFPSPFPFPTSGWLRKLCLPRHSFASSLFTTSPPPSASPIDFSHPPFGSWRYIVCVLYEIREVFFANVTWSNYRLT